MFLNLALQLNHVGPGFGPDVERLPRVLGARASRAPKPEIFGYASVIFPFRRDARAPRLSPCGEANRQTASEARTHMRIFSTWEALRKIVGGCFTP